ncbi:GNAT family N-acetyltransferase [Sungkyunkwania multivorans]|uniref:GNAT family N-acetyltransferase n=1 Tax=Sungkyunkwania multivorans TaxID=1173618 RepID=A0ABW3D224_9FLAO
MSLEFIRCTSEHVPALSKIGRLAYKQSYTDIWKGEDVSLYIEKSFSEEALQKNIEHHNFQLFLIRHDEQDAGLIKIRIDSAIGDFKAKEAMELEKIYLAEDFTNKGIGNRAFEFVCFFAKTHHKKALRVDVMTTSPALKFYQRAGFVTISTYDLAYPGIKKEHREMQRMLLKL